MADDRQRNEQGQFEPEHDDAAFLAAVRAHAPAGTQEVADSVGVERPSAAYRLEQLANAGVVNRKKVGARAVVWWPTGTEWGGEDGEGERGLTAAAARDSSNISTE